jgi:hypothetical protein
MEQEACSHLIYENGKERVQFHSIVPPMLMTFLGCMARIRQASKVVESLTSELSEEYFQFLLCFPPS